MLQAQMLNNAHVKVLVIISANTIWFERVHDKSYTNILKGSLRLNKEYNSHSLLMVIVKIHFQFISFNNHINFEFHVNLDKRIEYFGDLSMTKLMQSIRHNITVKDNSQMQNVKFGNLALKQKKSDHTYSPICSQNHKF